LRIATKLRPSSCGNQNAAHAFISSMQIPEIGPKTALFLDFDGTLVEIAETPARVVVPPELPALLTQLRDLLGGAVAIVSGRPLLDTDRLLTPFSGASSGEHGAAIRHVDGTLDEVRSEVAVPEEWKKVLTEETGQLSGVILELKPHGVTLHYRLAPEREDDVWRIVRALVGDDHPWFRLIPARKAVEIGVKATDKGRAVETLMARPPFAGRVPLFIGDDFADEAGMAAARRLGGQGLRVGEVFGGEPASVRAWLQEGVERLRLPVMA